MYQADEMQLYFFIWGWGLQVRTASCYDHQGKSFALLHLGLGATSTAPCYDHQGKNFAKTGLFPCQLWQFVFIVCGY